MNQEREETAIVSGSEDNASAVGIFNNFEHLSVSSSSSSVSSVPDNNHARTKTATTTTTSSDTKNKNREEEEESFYDSNLDDEDEDFVHRFMRGLVQEKEESKDKPISKEERKDSGEPVLKKSGAVSSSPSDTKQPSNNCSKNNKPGLKPRDSDAVLDCPCCFTTVCMDCQQHAKYTNQYRAMFVMNIGVDWRRKMIFNEAKSALEEQQVTAVDVDVVLENQDNSKDMHYYYYPVFCTNCGTEVAALNMKDEIYHFYGCIASAG